jgi:hypothetical protein
VPIVGEWACCTIEQHTECKDGRLDTWSITHGRRSKFDGQDCEGTAGFPYTTIVFGLILEARLEMMMAFA